MAVIKLNVYGFVGQSGWWSDEDAITTSYFDKQLLTEPLGESVEVYINTPGGLTSEGIGIFNKLRNHAIKAKAANPDFTVTTYNEGNAFSAGSIIFLAGDKRVMGLGASTMIHNAWMFAEGDCRQLRKDADYLEGVNERLIDIYAEVTGQKPSALKQMLDDETYMSSDECVTLKFATEKATFNQHGPQAYWTKETLDLRPKNKDYSAYLRQCCAFKYAKPLSQKNEPPKPTFTKSATQLKLEEWLQKTA